MPTRPASRTTLLLLPLLTFAGLAGCNKQRPLHVVQASGDRMSERTDADLAVKEYEEYITRRPEDHTVRYKLAQQYMALKQPKDAIPHLQVANDVKPLNDTYADALAEAYFQANERELLVAFLQRTSSERGRVADFTRLGTYQAKLGNADEAQQALLTAAKIDKGMTPAPQLALAKFYESVGDKKRALDRYRMVYFFNQNNEELDKKIRELGEIPGPTFGVQPIEAR